MARVTVEDCLDKVANRFELVLGASARARQLSRGATPVVSRGKHKDTVLALKEIASGKLDMKVLLSNFDVEFNKTSKPSELFVGDKLS